MPPTHTIRENNRPSIPPRLGCVSYLNSKPLIDRIEQVLDDADKRVRFEVPAKLLALLESRESGTTGSEQVEVALCPVIDYFRSQTPLVIVPVGGICCDGPTLTVRLFSRVPIDRITTVHADTDSHTSVALMRVLLHEMYDLTPRLIDFDADISAAKQPDRSRGRQPVGQGKAQMASAPTQEADLPESMLLIGDKVVTASPRAIHYPHQLDLGETWKRMTGLPFCFATWQARADADLGELPERLAALRDHNARRIDAIVDRYADAHGWPPPLAREYLGSILRYRVGESELEAIRRFGELAAKLNLIDAERPLQIYEGRS